MIRTVVGSLCLVTFCGCVSQKIATALPPGHPADSQAREAIFTPPPNPFARPPTPDSPAISPDTEGEEKIPEHGHHHPGGIP